MCASTERVDRNLRSRRERRVPRSASFNPYFLSLSAANPITSFERGANVQTRCHNHGHDRASTSIHRGADSSAANGSMTDHPVAHGWREMSVRRSRNPRRIPASIGLVENRHRGRLGATRLRSPGRHAWRTRALFAATARFDVSSPWNTRPTVENRANPRPRRGIESPEPEKISGNRMPSIVPRGATFAADP
jgi:hypothetical protein